MPLEKLLRISLNIDGDLHKEIVRASKNFQKKTKIPFVQAFRPWLGD